MWKIIGIGVESSFFLSMFSPAILRSAVGKWFFLLAAPAIAASSSIESSFTLNRVRIQFLSPSLIRLEERGPRGFEDRSTFNVLGRQWPGVAYRTEVRGKTVQLTTAGHTVILRADGRSLNGATVRDASGNLLYAYDGSAPGPLLFPSPAEARPVWVMADNPRLVPPPRGVVPLPSSTGLDQATDVEWDLGNGAVDLYVFMPGDQGYAGLRSDFLKLTGRIPLPPLYSFGLFDSRYHAYTQEEALAVIDEYRAKDIPLDVFVVDTDWRVGGSAGYEIETKYFPDMQGFIRDANARGVRTMFNDHPSPHDSDPLSVAELGFRYRGLKSLFDLGADAWWYDRNWHTHLGVPHPEVSVDAWGMRVYHDIARALRPGRRPFLMANVEGINHGVRTGSASPSVHRYPVWWTGDSYAEWEYLRRGVVNAVDLGIDSLLPYVNEDLGGHNGTPTSDLYLRFLQYGVFSPMVRLHSSGEVRFPWGFGGEAEKIAREYIKLRYRLLPYIYGAAREVYDSGTPLLRRGDLSWPNIAEAADPTQYMFGDDLLVAPVLNGDGDYEPLPLANLRNGLGGIGVQAEYFDRPSVEGEPVFTETLSSVDFNWGSRGSPHKLPIAGFAIRYSGQLAGLTPGLRYRLGLFAIGQVAVKINGEVVADYLETKPQAHWIDVVARDGNPIPFSIEYLKVAQRGMCRLLWQPPSMTEGRSERTCWIPPGEWQDLWTGATFTGPRTITVSPELDEIPLYARGGGIIFSFPQLYSTRDVDYSTVVVDAFVPTSEGSQTRLLYEDDGDSVGYTDGQFTKQAVTLTRSKAHAKIEIVPVTALPGRVTHRNWVIRLNLPCGVSAGEVRLVTSQPATGHSPQITTRLIPPSAQRVVIPFAGEGTAQGPLGGSVVEIKIPRWPLAEPLRLEAQLR